MKKATTEYEKKAWRLVILCWFAYTTVYIGKKTLSMCLPGMIESGVCDKVTGGTIGTCFMICYACGQLVNGWIGEKIHPRIMICGGLFAAGAMNILMSIGNSPALFLPVWALCGFSCSMIWAPIIRAVSTWTTGEISTASAASLSATIPAGTLLCYLVCALSFKLADWRMAFLACGLILCVFAVVYWIIFMSLRSHMKVAPKAETAKADNAAKKEADGGKEAKRGNIGVFCFGLVVAAFGILFNGMLKDGLDLWIPTALSEKFISDAEIVSLICTILPVANLIGVYFCKMIYVKYKLTELNTCALMFAISAAAIGIVLIFMYNAGNGNGIIAAIIVTLLLSLSSAAMLGANTMLLTYIPLRFGKIGRASAVTGTLNCFSYAAAAASGVAVGSVSDILGWEGVFFLFMAAAAAGALACFFGRNGMKKKYDELDAFDAETNN